MQPPVELKWKLEEYIRLVPYAFRAAGEIITGSEIRQERVRFGGHSQQYVLLFYPIHKAPKRDWIIYFLYGGGWKNGAPRYFQFVGNFFARLGYPTILGGYRLTPEHRYPAQVEDAIASFITGVKTFRSRKIQFKGMIIGGQSAGAHLSSLLAFDREVLPLPEEYHSLIRGYFSLSGPLDFSACTDPALQEMIQDFTVNTENWKKADPIRHVSGNGKIHSLLLHGNRDHLVDIQNTNNFAERLRQAQTGPVDVHIVRGWHHADLAALFWNDLAETNRFMRWMDRIPVE